MKSARFARRALATAALALLLAPSAAQAQAVLKVNDDVNFRFGFQFQGWADWTQSATTGGYAQNLFIRRARLLVGGSVAKDVTFFFQTDSGNLGKVTNGVKATSTGFVIQDAWVSWKLDDAFILDAGLFLVPLSRNILQSTLSFYTLDISPTSTVMAGPTQTVGLRDTGFQAKGYLVDGGRLEYRLAAMQGVRDAASQNSFRTAGYLQYNFFEKERGYVFAGTNLGKKKVLNLNGGFDVQKDYKAYSGDVFASIPVAKGDEVGGQVQWIHYDGGTFLKTIPKQDDVLVEAAYYLSKAKVQPFLKYESQKFANDVDTAKDQDRFGGGLNWYVSGQNFKITAQYLHVDPKSSALKSTGQFTIQLQGFYF
ncbi:MAG: porin [Thermoanaerobaculia bacterium]